MSVVLRILLVIGAIGVTFFILSHIRKAKLKIEYSIFWLGFSVVLILMGIFPQLFYQISDWIGFQSPVNMVFLVIIFALIVKLFFMTIQISQLENKVDELTQEVAIDRKIDRDDKKGNKGM